MNTNNSKPHNDIDELREKMQERGLKIDDEADANHFLSHVNYYYFNKYTYPFRITKAENNSEERLDNFYPGTDFKTIKQIYLFDQELSVLLFAAIKKIEISLRCQISHHLSKSYSSHPYDELKEDIVAKIKAEVKKTKNPIIEKRLNKDKAIDNELELPHIWATINILNFGTLLKLYRNMPDKARYPIYKQLNLDYKTLYKILDHFKNIRNRCAHHDFLWIFVDPGKTIEEKNPNIKKTIDLLASFMQVIDQDKRWENAVYKLIYDHQEKIKIPRIGSSNNKQYLHTLMGFHKNWPSDYCSV
jgi:abortive infection bacteriophage resistance protein